MLDDTRPASRPAGPGTRAPAQRQRPAADREVPLEFAVADFWAALQPELARRRAVRAPVGFERRVMAAIRTARR